MQEPLYEEERHGFKIKIYQDESYQEDPNDWQDDIILVHYHRDFEIHHDIITKDECIEAFNGKKVPQMKKYHFFLTKAYIHSGVVLALEESKTWFPDEQWDVSRCGYVLVKKSICKDRKKAYELANSQIKVWNDLNNGNVFGYVVEHDEVLDLKNETPDSCWGFVGDYDEKGGCLDQAREVADELHKKLHNGLTQLKLAL